MTGPSYTREEVEKLGDERPSRGEWCGRCRLFVPRFADLDEQDVEELRLLQKKNPGLAMRAIQEKTGASMYWAKLWVLHSHGVHEADPVTPCPYCGEPLRTPKAKQCPHCKADWHVPGKLRRLGDPRP
ncbi:MAG: hypothetical protein AAF533_08890 [Acidobacteriota bacterium]